MSSNHLTLFAQFLFYSSTLTLPWKLLRKRKSSIFCICSLNALFDNLPEFGSVDSPRNFNTLLTLWKQLGQCATGLLTLLSLFKRALSYDCDFEAFIMFRGLAVLGVPLEEGNLIFGADKYSSNSNRIMQRGSSGNTEGITELLVEGAHVIGLC